MADRLTYELGIHVGVADVHALLNVSVDTGVVDRVFGVASIEALLRETRDLTLERQYVCR